MSETMVKPHDAPQSIYGPDGLPQFFQDPAVDRLVAVVLNLASELWVQTEKIDNLTSLLKQNCVVASDATLIATPEDEAEREAAIRDFVSCLLAPLRERTI